MVVLLEPEFAAALLALRLLLLFLLRFALALLVLPLSLLVLSGLSADLPLVLAEVPFASRVEELSGVGAGNGIGLITVVEIKRLRPEQLVDDEIPVVDVERFSVDDEWREDISDASWVCEDDCVLRVADEACLLFRLK